MRPLKIQYYAVMQFFTNDFVIIYISSLINRKVCAATLPPFLVGLFIRARRGSFRTTTRTPWELFGMRKALLPPSYK